MHKKYYYILERKFYEWLINNRLAIILYFITLLVIMLTFLIPYLNLYINNKLIIFLVIASAMVIFQVSIEKVALLSIILFIICLPLVIIRDYDRAELIINFVYGFLFITCISYFLKHKD